MGSRYFWAGLLLAAVAGAGQTGNRLRLKNPSVAAARQPAEQLAAAPKRRAWSRPHFLLRFRQTPTWAQVEELARRGARVLRYVPDSGLLVSAAGDSFPAEGLDLEWARSLRPEDKLSPALAGTDTTAFVVDFHPDVDPAVARALAREQNLNVREHPDLLPNELLLEGPPECAERLAEWDEVAYVFPASRQLAEGERVEACAGAITLYGPVGQYVALVGEGWDGAGRGPARLGYFFSRLTDKLPAETAQAEILRAFAEWAKYATLEFVPARAAGQPRSLDILFASGEHGDSFPFDGSGKVLAHTFYPAPPNPESIAGDLHFDADEEWTLGGRRDLFSIALHEAGHALGLGHSDKPGTVMYPYYSTFNGLTADDIAAVQELYGTREGSLEPPEPEPEEPPEPPSEPEIPSEPREPSAPPSEPEKPSTPQPPNPKPPDPKEPETPQPKKPDAPASTPLGLVVQSAPAETASEVLPLAGRVDGGKGAVAVRWSTDRGFSGIAEGSRNWSARVPLGAGANRIAITATDSAGAVANGEITVSRRVNQAPRPPTDTVAPTLTILFPATTSYLTYASSISLRGSAADNIAVITVMWSHSSGAEGIAQGTSYWSTDEIPLREGANTITMRAKDAAGNVGWRTVVITRIKRE